MSDQLPQTIPELRMQKGLEGIMADAGIENLAVLLVAGLAAGWLAGIVTRGSGFGPLGNMLVALAGALAGLSVGGWLGFGEVGDLLGKALAALSGAFGLLYVVAQFRR
jgi:uncharacterized membrane protein YeaQ/YmgE (transglycosylase-associated protein family)